MPLIGADHIAAGPEGTVATRGKVASAHPGDRVGADAAVVYDLNIGPPASTVVVVEDPEVLDGLHAVQPAAELVDSGLHMSAHLGARRPGGVVGPDFAHLSWFRGLAGR